MIADAIDKARRGETAWSQKPETVGAALGTRRITSAVLDYRMNGVDNALGYDPDDGNARERYVPNTGNSRSKRAKRVWVETTITGSAGGTEEIEIESDLAVLDPNEHWPTEYGIALSAETAINVEELVELLVQACYEPRAGDPDDDSAETQRAEFDAHALVVATSLLFPRCNALERQLEHAVRRYGANLLHEGESATIRIRSRRGGNGTREVHTTVHGA